ncbi:hypothetical protein ASG31_04045 [Chryseobacterium sp. Leaf404]|uniref:DUF4255 domain-containing protein n=1 Tax=unclassified Chryseobacterium TaxID=2593645 RepID=UPI0006F65B02|nr:MULTISPECIES: DUF4255 domain-containing protein [unclassified Chryseobacterium]KQT17919.1 hypothetical protein ASG31_04045 [Chryseobacterium sp. Leaf404]
MNLRKLIELLCRLVDPVGTMIETVNISTINDGDEFFDTSSPIILSIVNIEEDRTMKNQTVYFKNNENQDQISRYKNPTQYFVLSLLFASYNKAMNKYLDGIDKLNHILVFFQQHNSFFYKDDHSELITLENFHQKTESEKQNYKRVTMEIVSLGTEQLNQMWSYLGSKYMPSVLYKMRLCEIQESQVSEEGIITKVRLHLWENNKNNPAGEIESGEFQG